MGLHMKWTIRKKLLFLSGVVMVLLVTTLSLQNVRDIISRGQEQIAAYRKALLAERQTQITNIVDMAIGLIENGPQENAKAIIKKLRYGKNDYVWVNDYNHFMIAHPDPELEGKDMTALKDIHGVYILQELVKVCKEKGQGFVPYYWKRPGGTEPKPKISFAKAIPKWNWVVGTGVYVDDIDELVTKEQERITADVNKVVLQTLVVAAILLTILFFAFLVLIRRFITSPLERISHTMKNFNNDLTIRIPVTGSDEISDLGTWFNDHMEKLRAIIAKIAEVSQRINSATDEISASVDQQVSFSTELSSSVVEISSTMEEFSATATQIANHSQGVVHSADRALQEAHHGAAGVENLTMRMTEINHENQANLREIVELGKKSKEITKIMEIINNVANQTKLIAFNAALEAASAGDAGKRFGVVAVEIRRLADNVVGSTREIEGKVTEIMDAVNRLVMSSEKGSKGVESALEYCNRTMTMLSDMVKGSEETTGAARQISLSTQQQQTASSQVLMAIREIEQGMRSSSQAIRQINNSSRDLNAKSNDLQELLASFRLGDEPGAALMQSMAAK